MNEIINKCLVLNTDYSPLKIISWKQAIIIDFRNKNNKLKSLEILEYHNQTINGVNKKYNIPSIIKINKYMNLNKRIVGFSRKNLFIRDKNTCQYCGVVFINSYLTYDHIIPKSRFKPNTKQSTNWKNIVTSCRGCNAKKGNKTPSEAGMTLLSEPYVPRYDIKYLSLLTELDTINSKAEYQSWKPFIKNYYEKQCLF